MVLVIQIASLLYAFRIWLSDIFSYQFQTTRPLNCGHSVVFHLFLKGYFFLYSDINLAGLTFIIYKMLYDKFYLHSLFIDYLFIIYLYALLLIMTRLLFVYMHMSR